MSINRLPAATASKVGKYLIWHTQHHGDAITNLKLQKLLYYAQGWFLALNNRVLFAEPIQAWVRGPVVPSVWREYKHYSWNPITERLSEPELTKAVKEHLNELMVAYGSFSAYTLERVTHRETPWLNSRGNLAQNANCSREVSLEDMQSFFTKLAKRKN